MELFSLSLSSGRLLARLLGPPKLTSHSWKTTKLPIPFNCTLGTHLNCLNLLAMYVGRYLVGIRKVSFNICSSTRDNSDEIAKTVKVKKVFDVQFCNIFGKDSTSRPSSFIRLKLNCFQSQMKNTQSQVSSKLEWLKTRAYTLICVTVKMPK